MTYRRLSASRLLPTLCAFAWLFGAPPCRAVPLTVLHTFGAGGLDNLNPADHKNADGARPESPLMQGRDGALYGTTSSGGAHGTGVIFRVNPDGTGFTLLHAFGPLDALFVNATNADGAWPMGALVQGDDGALYGTSGQGGLRGSGTVFRLNPEGTGFTVLHVFNAKEERDQNSGGAEPAGLTATEGVLCGVTVLGGNNGAGTIFKLGTDGRGFRTLHTFAGVGEDNRNGGGARPGAAPVFGRDGALYGTVNSGGRYGYGVIYRMTTDGKGFTVLHHFQRKGLGFESNGVFPEGPLTASADGILYGSTRQGGADDSGILFKMGQDGTGFTVLHTFTQSGNGDEGWLPGAAPLLGGDGRLYGVAGVGGADGVGTLFWMSTDGAKFVVIHDFGAPDAAHHKVEGTSPGAKLIQGRDGALYGAANSGGLNGNGTLFRLMPPHTK